MSSTRLFQTVPPRCTMSAALQFLEEPVWYPDFYQRDVADGMLSPSKLPGDVVSPIFQELVKVCAET